MNSLIIYSTTDGHTKKICEFIKSNSLYKNTCEIVSLDTALKIKLETYDRIIIGASIRYGKHNSKLYDLVKINKDLLSSKKSAFFSVNVVARKKEKNSPETNPYIKKFLKKSRWQPSKIGVFAGKIDYPNLNFFNRRIIQLIMLITNGPTDLKKSYELTDWSSVKDFTKKIDELVN